MAEIVEMEIKVKDRIELELQRGGGSNNYNTLTNKPQINSVTLIGNKTGEELNLQDKMKEITNQEIDTIIYG